MRVSYQAFLKTLRLPFALDFGLWPLLAFGIVAMLGGVEARAEKASSGFYSQRQAFFFTRAKRRSFVFLTALHVRSDLSNNRPLIIGISFIHSYFIDYFMYCIG